MLQDIIFRYFGIHLRNLIDFLFTPPGEEHPDDVIAADFCPSWNEAISVKLDAARVRANKEVSHLTPLRKAGFDPTKPWTSIPDL